MPLTVEAGFDRLHLNLTPSDTETEAARLHRASINSCLVSNFQITRFFRTGSFGNGTSIRSYSDVDYFASMPSNHLSPDSSLTLQKVRDALVRRFPNTGVRIDAPAVLVPFGRDASESTEVVPASYEASDSLGRLIYKIPNSNRGWMRSSPDIHNAYVSTINDRLGKQVKSLIRFIKAWKCYNDVPVSSFYLEMFVASYAYDQTSIFYSLDTYLLFQRLRNGALYAMSDPMGISGSIYACTTEAKRLEALEKLRLAATRSSYAWEAEKNGKIADQYLRSRIYTPTPEAIDQEEMWCLLLNTKNRITHEVMVYRGTINTIYIRPAELFKEAVRVNAPALLLSHVHPSGSPDPSPEDIRATHNAYQAGKLLGIDVLDHIIVGRESWISLREKGLGFSSAG